jgi:chemotaxis protein CheC
MEEEAISFLEQDILREVGSVCVGNATIALEQVIGRRIELELPSLRIIKANELPKYLSRDPEEIVVGLHTKIVGGARGNALLIFVKNEAFSILDLLIGSAEEKPSNLTELGISALREMGNIVISSYLSALGNFVGISAFPSTVTFTSGSIDSLVNLAFFGLGKVEDIRMLIIEAVLKESKRHLSGKFFIIFDSNTIKVILSQAKKLIEPDDKKNIK